MASSAATAEGQMKRFHAATSQLNEALGKGLLPIVQAVIPLLIKVSLFAQDNAKVIQILAAAVAVFSGGILAANLAMKAYTAIQTAVKVATAAWTAAQWLLNAALNANPIGLITIAIAALVAGIIIAYKKSETFRDIVQAAMRGVQEAVAALGRAFDAVVAAASAAWNWVASHWKLALFAFGPLGAAIGLIALNWDKVSAAAKAAWDVMTSAIDAVSSAIHSVISAVESLISALGRIKVPSIHLPSLGGINPFAYPGAPAVAGYGASSRSSSSSVTVNVYGAIDPEGTARTIRRVLDDHDRRMGRSAG
jgi:phage-related protein